MIAGTVTTNREAIVPLQIEGPTGRHVTVEAAIDTGFNGFLVVSASLVECLSLPVVGGEPVTLADGSETTLAVVAALVHWHGQPLPVPALQAAGGVLIGMALLEGSDLTMAIVEDGELRIRPLHADC